MANLSLKHIYKVYPNGTKAVNDFNININDKEFIVLVGPSGCGKSTTLRMIAGLEEISTGELKIGDQVVNAMEPKDRDIAMVFQNYALYPHMSIYENIAFGLQMRKVDKEEIDRRVKEAAETLGITEYLNKKPKEMSGGQRQRVALGRAIVREPKVMLLDEPLSNLDAKLRTQMRSEIVKLHKKLQTTFIYVTHDQIEAMTMGTRIVVMKDGFVKQIDTPKNLYKYPENKFVAGFIGSPQMNFFNGRIIRDDEDVVIRFTDVDSELRAPYNMMMKVKPEYLDGSKEIIIGIRPEDIRPSKNKKGTLKVLVSHTEELGTETLIYGDLDLNNKDFNPSSTRVILKDSGFKDYEFGTTYNIEVSIEGIHLFDKESEESICPRIPEFNNYLCEVQEDKIKMLDDEFSLPPVLSSHFSKGEIRIPPAAVIKGSLREAKVVSSELIGDKYLITLDYNKHVIYALSEEDVQEETFSFDFDYKKVIIKLEDEVVEPMPLLNTLEGHFIREEVKEKVLVKDKEKYKKVPKYSLLIHEVKIPSNDEVTKKMCSSLPGRQVFNTNYAYEWNPYDFIIGEEGFEAEVIKTLDYGKEKFLVLKVYDQTFYVYTEESYEGKIKIMPRIEKTNVVEIKRNIRII